MSHQLRVFPVTHLRWAEASTYAHGRLDLNRDELRSKLLALDPDLREIRLDVAYPGQSLRIVCVKDVIRPQVNGSALKSVDTSVQPTIHVLENLAVVTCGPIVGFQEGIIDMQGPAATYSAFSTMPLLVLQLTVADGVEPHQHESLVRRAGLTLARMLAELTSDADPREQILIDWQPLPADNPLPRIAYVYMVLSQGLLHDTYVLGTNAREHQPAVVAPWEILDTGIVSGNCVSACDKNTTYHHQTNPVLGQLLAGHGKRWNFVGAVITNEPVRLAEKQQSAAAAVAQVVQLGAQGAVITKEGFGNPDADLMMLIRGLEQAGIRTVALTDEYAGADGGSHSLADSTPEANAIVSTGNANQRITLPAMQTTLGPLPDITRIAGGYPYSVHADGTLDVELQAIIGATNQLGATCLRCREW